MKTSTTSGMVEAREALREAMTGPTSGGIARQLAPVVLGAIVSGQVPGVSFTPFPPIDPTTGRPANYRKLDGTWVTIAEGD